jgi:hypothetical protein
MFWEMFDLCAEISKMFSAQIDLWREQINLFWKIFDLCGEILGYFSAFSSLFQLAVIHFTFT